MAHRPHVLATLLVVTAGCTEPTPPVAAAPPVATTATATPPAATTPKRWTIAAPDPATIPDGPVGDAIRRGQDLVTHTATLLPDHVGADLSCTSCHRQGGTLPNAGPWVGITGVFPEYRARTGRVASLETRINDCFERSLNGTPIAPDGPDMAAILTYMSWLSQGVPVGVPVEGRGFEKLPDPPTPDPEHGKALFAEKCSACHGGEGQGLKGPDGATVYPPLWGDASFNVGAGMARLDTAAAFVRWNMPLGQGGTLSPQDAYDLAAYFTVQPRPDFARKHEDWPNGGKPRDARY